ncbi:hypothetical protein PYW07_016777 [Mythimna separata]|uniref:Uncharacterized protein n=1 Tax=Mythimna separata TaxID=271217 RepID=A0AAD8DRW3_MYTSE|nr:hypothetical protein PYW07_016777 [Mythimna separata]
MCVDKLHGWQSLSTTDGDNLSVCTTDTDEFRYVARRDKPQLDSLVVESLSTTDGDNLSVCTTDTDEFRYVARRDKPQLDSLVVEVSSLHVS